jgi:trigger factor
MKVTRKELDKSQAEFLVVLDWAEFENYLPKAAESLSKNIKIEGFRPGKVPYDILKQNIGEMAILEEAANMAIRKTIDKVFAEHGNEGVIGQPKVEVSKLAPNNPLEYKIIADVLPSVNLGKYKDFAIKKDEAVLDDKEIDKALLEMREMRTKELPKLGETVLGDKLVVDIEMFIDKVPTDGGQIKDLPIVLGKGYFVPGFDDKMLAQKKGAELEFSLDYPEKHHQGHLAGKKVDFKVKIKEVFSREIPELNDELAINFGMKTAVELRDFIVKSLKDQKQIETEKKREAEIFAKIVEGADFGNLPEALINNEAHNMLHELEHEVEHQGGKFADYLASLNKTHDQLQLDMVPQALRRVKIALAIREIAKIEKMEATDEELIKRMEELKVVYKNDENFSKMVDRQDYRQHVRGLLTNDKVINALKDWNLVR